MSFAKRDSSLPGCSDSDTTNRFQGLSCCCPVVCVSPLPFVSVLLWKDIPPRILGTDEDVISEIDYEGRVSRCVPFAFNATICELSFADSRPRPRFLTDEDEAVVITVFRLQDSTYAPAPLEVPFLFIEFSNQRSSLARCCEIVGFGFGAKRGDSLNNTAVPYSWRTCCTLSRQVPYLLLYFEFRPPPPSGGWTV